MEAMYKTNPRIIDTSRYITIQIKDFWSAVTHGLGAVAATVSIPFLIDNYARKGADLISMIGAIVFGISMILLYTASTLYHSIITDERKTLLLKKFDHMMISVLIAGSYTPLCLTILRNGCGYYLLAAIWTMALTGILIKYFWVTCPKWFSSILYIGMGWLCIFALPAMYRALPIKGFMWLFVGGLIYTAGGIIYALKLNIFNSKHKQFGSHEVFHLFVLAGNICHFILIYKYLL